MMNIYDCFQYFDEDLLLDIRLNVLNQYVKKFVISEATYTHNGTRKKLNFDINNYPKFPYNAYRTIEWWKRQKLACEFTGQDYIMILEDDVLVRKPFTLDSTFQLRGVRIGNRFTSRMSQDVKDLTGDDASLYGMCGGSMYNAETFLSIYDDVIEDIETNMDNMMKEDPTSYNMLGAVDANITYHFAKRGYKYEVAPWLGEVREGNLDLPVIHQWKEHY